EGTHVEGAETRVLALVGAHVDARSCHAGGAERPFHRGGSRAHEVMNGAVGGGALVHVEERAAGSAADGLGDRVDHGLVTTFGEVGHALDDLSHREDCNAKAARLPAARVRQGASSKRLTRRVKPRRVSKSW